MDNKDISMKQEIDSQDLENVIGGLSDSRKAEIRDYVAFLKRKHFCLESIKINWSERSVNRNLSSAQLDEDYRYIEQIFE